MQPRTAMRRGPVLQFRRYGIAGFCGQAPAAPFAVVWNAGKIHEGAVGRARNHFEQLSGAEVLRRRGVDRGGGARVSRMLGRELAGKEND